MRRQLTGAGAPESIPDNCIVSSAEGVELRWGSQRSVGRVGRL